MAGGVWDTDRVRRGVEGGDLCSKWPLSGLGTPMIPLPLHDFPPLRNRDPPELFFPQEFASRDVLLPEWMLLGLRGGMRVGNERGRPASGGWLSIGDSFGASSTQLEFDRFDESTYLRRGCFEAGEVVLFHRLEPIIYVVQKHPVCGDGIIVERSGALAESQITEIHKEIRTKEVQNDAPLKL